MKSIHLLSKRLAGAGVFLTLSLSLAGCALSPPSALLPPPLAEMPADLQSQVQAAETLGVAMFNQDTATAIATAALMPSLSASDEGAIGGWLTLLDSAADGATRGPWRVEFYSDEATPRILFHVLVPLRPLEKPRVERVEPPRNASAAESALIRARRAAFAAIPPPQQPINTILASAEPLGKSGVLVYLMAASDASDLMVLGKHYRVLVDEQRAKVVQIDALSKGELRVALPVPQADAAPAQPIFVKHIVTDWPLEHHVFANLQHRVPLVVLTPRGAWWVDKGAIGFLSATVPEDPSELLDLSASH